MKALIVDDSRVLRLHMSRLMQTMGWETTEVENGRLAFEALSVGPDIVLALMDVNMPEVNGLECVRRVRRELPLHPVKVLMVTTEADFPLIEGVLRDGADEFLMKPFTADNLRDKLQLLSL
jgi:two-component system chemotaxis response regulator CheY